MVIEGIFEGFETRITIQIFKYTKTLVVGAIDIQAKKKKRLQIKILGIPLGKTHK